MGQERASSRLLIAILFLTVGDVLLDRMTAMFLGPYIVADLHLSGAQVGLIASATSICWALSSVVFGAVSDRIGRRKVLIPAVVLFSLCSWLSALAQNFEQMLLCRALLGLAEGPCWAVIMALVEETTPAERRGRNIGIVSSASSLMGSALAPVLTTQLASLLGWRWSFVVVGIPGLVLAVLIYLYVKEPERRRAGPAEAVRPWHLATNGSLWLCLFGAFGLVTWLFVFTVFAPLYITGPMGQSATTAGFLLSCSGVGGFLWAFFGTGIADRIGRRRALILFSCLCAGSPLVFMVPALYSTPMVLAGLAMVLSAGPSAAALVMVLIPSEAVPRRNIAVAIGFAGMGADLLGGTISPALGGMLADRYGLVAPMLLSVAGAVLMLVVGLLIKETLATAPAVAGLPEAEGGRP